jgi:hypothetical protein
MVCVAWFFGADVPVVIMEIASKSRANFAVKS